MKKTALYVIVILYLLYGCSDERAAINEPTDLSQSTVEVLSKKGSRGLVGTWEGDFKIVSDTGFKKLSVILEIVEQQDNLFRGSMTVGPQTQDLEIYGIIRGTNVKAVQRWVLISGRFKGKNLLSIDLRSVARVHPPHQVYTRPFAASGTLQRQ